MSQYLCDRCGKDSPRGLLTMDDETGPDVVFAKRKQRCCFDCHSLRMAEFWQAARKETH